jgi:hypothetical protein
MLQLYRNRRLQLTNLLRNKVSGPPKPLLLGISLHQQADNNMITDSFGHGLNYFVRDPLASDRNALHRILDMCKPKNEFSTALNKRFGFLTISIDKYLNSLPNTTILRHKNLN